MSGEPMIQPCPACGGASPRLDDIGRDAQAIYYRCDNCGTVWTKPKDADGPIHIVVRSSVKPQEPAG